MNIVVVLDLKCQFVAKLWVVFKFKGMFNCDLNVKYSLDLFWGPSRNELIIRVGM